MSTRLRLPLVCFITLALLTTGVLPSAGATKAVKGEFEVAPLIGHSWPLGSLRDDANGGFAFGVQGVYYLNAWMGAGLALNHNRFGIGGSGGRLGITEVLLVGKMLLPTEARVTPYGKVVAGLLIDAVSGSNVGGIGAGAALGVGAGVGVQGRIGESWGLFGEPLFMVHISDEVFGFLGLRVGANFYFGGGDH